MELTRKDPAASDYHLHGFEELSEQVKLYCCLAAFVSRVPDALLAELLENDALACKGPLAQELVEDEVQCLTVVPNDVWLQGASLLENTSASELRNLVLHSAYVALAMLHQQVFAPLASYPWCLCHGAVDEKLDVLADPNTDIPSCQATANLQFLLRSGYNRVLIKKALELLGTGALVHQCAGARPCVGLNHPPSSQTIRVQCSHCQGAAAHDQTALCGTHLLENRETPMAGPSCAAQTLQEAHRTPHLPGRLHGCQPDIAPTLVQ